MFKIIIMTKIIDYLKIGDEMFNLKNGRLKSRVFQK